LYEEYKRTVSNKELQEYLQKDKVSVENRISLYEFHLKEALKTKGKHQQSCFEYKNGINWSWNNISNCEAYDDAVSKVGHYNELIKNERDMLNEIYQGLANFSKDSN
ncbi:hypothetical protein, partial [Photobacterium halotolerans]|uniref:hypothetical protein n=1 Tax=Photobacterium halotolerans TaxID=265726 RepID=UPI001F17E1CA